MRGGATSGLRFGVKPNRFKVCPERGLHELEPQWLNLVVRKRIFRVPCCPARTPAEGVRTGTLLSTGKISTTENTQRSTQRRPRGPRLRETTRATSKRVSSLRGTPAKKCTERALSRDSLMIKRCSYCSSQSQLSSGNDNATVWLRRRSHQMPCSLAIKRTTSRGGEK